APHSPRPPLPNSYSSSIPVSASPSSSLFFFFTDTPTTEIYTLSLHDALPISARDAALIDLKRHPELDHDEEIWVAFTERIVLGRSEEHTSELQSRGHLVCRLLLEKKNKESETRNSPDRRTNGAHQGHRAAAPA